MVLELILTEDDKKLKRKYHVPSNLYGKFIDVEQAYELAHDAIDTLVNPIIKQIQSENA